MATTIINPAPSQESKGNSFLVGIVLFIAFILLLLYFGLPYIQQGFDGRGTQVSIPDKVDVNIQQQPE